MSEEEKEAIEELKWYFEDGIDEAHPIDIDYDIDIVLNLIQKQQTELRKKDKIIDKMSDMLVRVHSEDKFIEIIANANIEEKKKRVKQYFERKVENEC